MSRSGNASTALGWWLIAVAVAAPLGVVACAVGHAFDAPALHACDVELGNPVVDMAASVPSAFSPDPVPLGGDVRRFLCCSGGKIESGGHIEPELAVASSPSTSNTACNPEPDRQPSGVQ
ncbi:MAG: hypothetical protein ACRDR6_03910 [Pseudonocardiaceae bacterium]